MKVRILEDDKVSAQLLGTLLQDVEPDIWTKDFEKLRDPKMWEDVDLAIIDYQLASDVNGCEFINLLTKYFPSCVKVVYTGSTYKISECIPDLTVYKTAGIEMLRRIVGLPARSAA